MESDDRDRIMPEGIDGDDSFEALLVDFIDGTLSEEESQKVREHLSTCSRCASRLNSMRRSNIFTEKIRNGKKESLDAIQGSRREQLIAEIKQRIIKTESEPNVLVVPETANLEGKTEETGSETHAKKQKVLFFSKRWAFASTAAGIVMLLFVTFLFINGNTAFSQFFRHAGSFNILSPDNTKGGDNSTSGRAPEMQSTNQSLSSVTDAGAKVANQDTATSVYAGLPLFTAEEIREASARIFIAPDYSRNLAMLVQGAAAYLEIINNNTSYVFIAAYPSFMIQSKEQTLQDLKEKLNSLSLTTKIEFISRENSQKLVEYTSKENATLLQNNAEKNSADFLVISIYRE